MKVSIINTLLALRRFWSNRSFFRQWNPSAPNMIAGHLFLTLLGNAGLSLSSIILTVLILTQIVLLILDSAVAIIQSYVFAVLSTLYSSEVN